MARMPSSAGISRRAGIVRRRTAAPAAVTSMPSRLALNDNTISGEQTPKSPTPACRGLSRLFALFGDVAYFVNAMYLVSRYSSMPSVPPSRPKPDSLMPPNGAAGSEMTPRLIPTMPDSMASATRRARSSDCVKT